MKEKNTLIKRREVRMSLFNFSSSVIRSAKDRVGSVYTSVIMAGVSSMQVRTATKRAAGSKTHMKDSRGRRLGPKKQDGVFVIPGQIIMRQRGTKFYPGENVGIGRDHTIFATEPGWVRYYLDPFHPKRKFIGVALKREMRLPSPHFEPTVRRFGGVLLADADKASKEETRMSRKEHKAFPEILSKQQEREAKRLEKFENFKKEIPNYIQQDVDIELGASRLTKIDGFLRGGKNIKEAQFYATYNTKYDLNLALKRGEITQEELEQKLSQYTAVAKLIDTNISFDAHFKLRKYLSDEELLSKQNEIKELLQSKYYTKNPVITKEARSEIYDLIYSSQVFDLSTETLLQRKYLKPIDTGKTQVVRRYNYDTRKIDVMERPLLSGAN